MMIDRHVNLDTYSPHKPNDALDPFVEQSFPAGGLVAMSRIAYENTPLAILSEKAKEVAQGSQ
jgi:hypothetical protein